jgi:flagellar hook-basal body complex protein FliE
MSEILIRGGLAPPTLSGEGKGNAPAEQVDFRSLLTNAIEDINRLQKNADQAIADIQLEKTQSVHEAMIALEKASISFRAMMQVRNKILEAYQEIMRMQV